MGAVDEFKITDLVPRKACFNLSIPNRSYNLRPCTPKDLIDLKEKGIDIENVMKNPISRDVCRVALYLMDYDDAKEFKKVELKTINIETGDEETENVGGYELLMKFIASIKEQMDVFLALLTSMGFKKEIVEDIRAKSLEPTDLEIKDKKKVKKKKKKQF
jgi:hypothetical protein